MAKDVFFSSGKLFYKLRWFIIALWLAFLVLSIPFVPQILTPFKAIGFKDPQSESAKANATLNRKLGYGYNQFIVMYHSDKLRATGNTYKNRIKRSLKGLEDIPVQHQIIYPTKDNDQISKNRRDAYAVILFKGDGEATEDLLKQFRAAIKKPPRMTMKVGGEPIFLEDTKNQTQLDLYSAEYIATPVAIITMLLVFGSVVAASIPIVLGGISAFLTLMVLFCAGQFYNLSVFTINIALLVGLCLILDYALLIVNRFRDELYLGAKVSDAVAITQATAGKAVFFSGIAVFISLSALLLFPINILYSVGIGGLAAVFVAVSTAFILLPAVLGVLHRRVNLLHIKIFKRNNLQSNPFCNWLVTKVVKYKYSFFIVVLALLLAMGSPFLNAKFGISDFKILPKTQESRQVFDTFAKEFGENKLAPLMAVVKSKNNDILTKRNISALYDLGTKIAKDPRVESVSSVVNTDPRLRRTQYKNLYTGPKKYMPQDLKKLVDVTTNDDFAVFTIISKYPAYSKKTHDLIIELREMALKNNLTLELTGAPANTYDVLQSIIKFFPYALLWIMGFTYIILLFVLRSVFLPIKAVFTTTLSLFASYGILVLVFQMGYFHEILNFEPQGMLDISLLIIIFCALFGISMDYEVFLLARIKEYYEQTGDTEQSIITGIDRSWKIITSAAIIVIMLCFSFMAADILLVKAFGLGIAVAVFIDAYVIRTILVPALMAIMGRLNWYLPRFLDCILPNIQFDPENYVIKE